MKPHTIRNILVIIGLITAAVMSPIVANSSAIASPAFEVGEKGATAIVSDDFAPCRMLPDEWTQNLNGGTLTENGTQVTLLAPAGSTAHTIDGTGPGDFSNTTVNIMQAAPDEDFEIEVKFESVPVGAYAQEGIIIQQDTNNLLRIEFFSSSSSDGNVYLYVGKVVDGALTPQSSDLVYTSPSAPLFLKIDRTNDDWTISHSTDGSNWTDLTPFTFELTVTGVGVYGGNDSPDGGITPAPAFTAIVDYFFNNASRISPEDGETLSVTTQTAGEGSGTVTENPDAGPFSCGDALSLTANPAAGSEFAGWTGYWGGTLSSMTTPLAGNIYESVNATANFDLIDYTITANVLPVGAGTVAKDPDQATYHYDDSVDLTATANPGYTFANWSGDASGTNTATSITVTDNHTVTANFTQDEYTLTKTSNPVAGGSITADPDQMTYNYDDSVEVTAVPADGYEFTGWGGDASGTDLTTSITITGNTEVIANFALIEYTIDVTSTGGIITFDPNQTTFHYGDSVEITAVPYIGYAFTSWSGDLISTTNPDTVVVTGNMTITANYEELEVVFLPLVVK